MEKDTTLKKLILDSMPKRKEHWPLAVGFAVAFSGMVILGACGSWLTIPSGLLALYLSKKMKKKGVEINEL